MSAKRVLFISKKFLDPSQGGREMLSSLMFQSIKQNFDNLAYYEVDSEKLKYSKPGFFEKFFFGKIDGISDGMANSIINDIKNKNIDNVFLDGSNLGYFAQKIKTTFPNVCVICFFHNAEYKFFLDAFFKAKSLRSLAVLWINYIAERKAVLKSDHIITLTKDDSEILKKIYGKSAQTIVPIALKDQFKSEFQNESTSNSSKYILFVGGLFYANLFGIKWFIKNVSPYIKYKTIIVGSGFEAFKEDFERFKNVEVIGKVEHLDNWYSQAEYVIAPIFSGSGMKTKVAEAFMHGKKIIATSSALIGYDNLPENSYFKCNTKDEFIDLICSLQKKEVLKFDDSLRDIYEKNFSSSAFQKKLITVFQDL